MKFISINYIRLIFIPLLAMLLVSCVSDPTKSDDASADRTMEIYDIDSDIEDDFNTALSHLKSAEYDSAIKILEQIISVESRVPAPFINLGMAYDLKGDAKLAEKYLLEAVNIDLAQPVANNKLGLLYRKQGRFDDARKAYSNALTRNPEYLPVIKNLGILCELYIRDYPCAMKQYEDYQNLQPDDKTMKIWITDLSRRMGK